MRVRFISTYENGTTFYRDLLPYLAENGIDVDLLISSTEYRVGRESIIDAFVHPNIRVMNITSFGLKPTGRLQKGLISISFILGCIIQTLFGRPADLNIFFTQPPLFPIWGLVLKQLRKQRFAILVQDVYPEIMVMAGLLARDALITRLLFWLSKKFLVTADAVIAIGRCMAERFEASGVNRERIHIISNWVNEKRVFPIDHEQNSFRHELGLDGKFVILYSGNLGISHYFDDFMEVANRLSIFPDIQFVIIGDGHRQKEIDDFLNKKGIHNVIRLPFQPLARLSEIQNIGDIHFVTLREGFEGLVVPSKAYAALAAGRPLVYQGNANGEIGRLVNEHEMGCVVPIGRPDLLEQAILNYYHHPEILRIHQERARALGLSEYSCETMMLKFKNLILDLYQR